VKTFYMICFACLLVSRQAMGEVVLHVEPDASKQGEGSRERPFASIEAAREHMRELRMANEASPDEGHRIVLGDGVYFLERTVAFGSRDSGLPDHPLVIEAAPGARPILSGGAPVKDWQEHREGFLTARLPGSAGFRQLFTRKQTEHFYTRRYRPMQGIFTSAGRVAGHYRDPSRKSAPHRNAQDRFLFHEGDIQDWENLGDVELLILHDWASSRRSIRGIDHEKNLVILDSFPSFRIGHWYPGGRNPYLAVNVKEAFGKPGEWYRDSSRGRLMYTPAPGENRENLEAVAPRLETLLRLEGSEDEEKPVGHIVFRGITFAHTAWKKTPSQYAKAAGQGWAMQGFAEMPAAVELSNATHISFEDCSFVHLGGYAVELGAYTRNNRIEGCIFADMGAGGVNLSFKNRNVPDAVPTGNLIANNVFRGAGVQHFSGNAIFGGITRKTRIKHNLIQQSFYDAIALGWAWHERPTPAKQQLVLFNRIEESLMLLDHGGAIYTLGRQPGTLIFGNVIAGTSHTFLHGDRNRPEWAGGAFALDKGSSDFEVVRNVVYDSPTNWERIIQKRGNAITFRENTVGIEPGEPGYPEDIDRHAGLSPRFKRIAREAPQVALHPILEMRFPSREVEQP